MAYMNAPYQNKRRRTRAKHFHQNSTGAVYSVNHDGLIIARKRRRGVRLPVKGLLMIAVAFIGFKVLLVQSLGAVSYGDRLQVLATGSTAEKVGAYVMQIDPVTQWVSDEINKNF